MTLPNPQRYRSQGLRLGVDETVLERAVDTIERIRSTDANIVPVLTLRHLSYLSGVPYGYLRRAVGRRLGHYRQISLRKHIPGRTSHRLINIPPEPLMRVQQWVARNILRHVMPSPASFAYHPGCNPVQAAEVHRDCVWLLKIDVQDFFHAITEGRVSELFFRIGFSRLLSFELARLTTVILKSPELERRPEERWASIPFYGCAWEGVLPQGAPTSPMLSNLVMRDLDQRLTALSRKYKMRYTRYADDMAFSCCDKRDRRQVETFKRLVLKELSREGFRHNKRKTVIRGPGTRRIVLGMLVDGPFPKLPREFKEMLRLHLYFLTSPEFGPAKHAKKHKMSVSAIYHRVRGLIGWAACVEPEYGAECLAKFNEVTWPPVQPKWY